MALLNLHLHSRLNIWRQWIRQRQRQDDGGGRSCGGGGGDDDDVGRDSNDKKYNYKHNIWIKMLYIY